jgi:hypothetical protein
LGESALGLLEAGMSLAKYIGVLRANGLNFEVVPLLARAMTERAAVEWAVDSTKLALQQGQAVSPEGTSALDAAAAWAQSPAPTTKQLAQQAAAAAPTNEPAAWAAWGAAWSEETPGLAPSDGTALPPNNATADAVTGAVRLAALPALPPVPAAPEVSAFALRSARQHGVGAGPMEPQAREALETADAAELAKMHEALEPFIDLGLRIASQLAQYRLKALA